MSRPFISGWSPALAERARASMAARGLRYATATFEDDRPLPKAFSLAQYRKWPYDQGPVGSCFSNGPAQCAQLDMVFADPSRAFQVSRALIWYAGRKLDGSDGSRSDGGSVTNAMVSLSDKAQGIGAAHESVWPYKPSNSYLNRKPTSEVLADAGKTRFTGYAEVPFGDAWKRQIFNGRAIAGGYGWCSAWDESVDSTGRETGLGRIIGGHCTAFIGWVDDWDGHTWYQNENSHGSIYHPLPPEIAARVEGYPKGLTDKVNDFWCRDDRLARLFNGSDAEAIVLAGPEGFTKREPLSPETIMPWSTSVYFPDYGDVETLAERLATDPIEDEEYTPSPVWFMVLVGLTVCAAVAGYIYVLVSVLKVWG